VPHQFEVGIVEQVQDVILGPGKEVIGAQDVAASFQEPFAQVGTEKASASGHQNAFTKRVFHHQFLIGAI